MEQRYYEFELDVYREPHTHRPGPRGDPTRGGSPKNCGWYEGQVIEVEFVLCKIKIESQS